MKKTIRFADDTKGIVQVTTVDERWYARTTEDPFTGLPTYEYVPSVTWIASHYPKGIGFYKWLATHGWDESEAIKEAAADRGSKVHTGIAALLEGQVIGMQDAILNPSTGQPEELTLEEYEAILAFADWHQETKPELVAKDFVVWGDGYAGTVDELFRINRRLWLVGNKTGQDVWPSHRIQVTAYRDALPEALIAPHPREAVGLAILQVGYRRNKRGWKWTEIEPCPRLVAAAREIWAHETAGEKPAQRDYPLRISLAEPSAVASPTNGRRKKTAPPTTAPDDVGAVLAASVKANGT